MIHKRLRQLIKGLEIWLAADPRYSFSSDASTNLFCRSWLEKLTARPDLLEAKISGELGSKCWRPMGRVLVVVSERDVLGTALALFGGYLTGNRLRIKARATASLLAELAAAIGINADECEVLDWDSKDQDDAKLLEDVQTVVLAGSERLIAHYRKITPPQIRLVEFGPKLSVAAIGKTAVEKDLEGIAGALISDVCLFLQEVCSSPRFILVEDDATAASLYTLLEKKLPLLPKLSEDIRLKQALLARQRGTLNNLFKSKAKTSFCAESGWAVTLDREFTPESWLYKGFTIISGSIQQHLAIAAERWPGALQTLGLAGFNYGSAENREGGCVFSDIPEYMPDAGFTRICPLGKMHERPVTAPHDGFFELSSLVRFMSIEVENER